MAVTDPVKFLLIQDDSAPDAENHFNSQMKERYNLTIDRFKKLGKDISTDVSIGYRLNGYRLESFHDAQYWHLSHEGPANPQAEAIWNTDPIMDEERIKSNGESIRLKSMMQNLIDLGIGNRPSEVLLPSIEMLKLKEMERQTKALEKTARLIENRSAVKISEQELLIEFANFHNIQEERRSVVMINTITPEDIEKFLSRNLEE